MKSPFGVTTISRVEPRVERLEPEVGREILGGGAAYIGW